MTQGSGAGRSQSTSPQSTAFLLLIIFVILSEISVKTQAFLQSEDWGDKNSAGFQCQFPVTKGYNTSRAQRQ